MLAELTIIPVGDSVHPSRLLAEVREIIEASRLPYKITPSATCIEGSWDEVMPVIKACRECALESAPHIYTLVKIEDDALVRNKLEEETSAPVATPGPFSSLGDLIRLRPLAIA